MSVHSRRARNRELLILTEDLFGRSVDATLFLLSYITALSVIPSTKTRAAFQAHLASETFLKSVNYEVIKNALTTAWKRRFIVKRRHALPTITQQGRRRLQEIMPVYDPVRTWDGRLHAVTYDIPEKKHKARDLLRTYLRRLGCAKLQESVWLTPYNPIDVLRDFILEKDIEGTVIVSDLGKDASVGEETMEGLIVRLYNLEELHDRYKTWLDIFGDPRTLIQYEGLVRYLSILNDDPQLPFALLPKWWSGDRAYKTIKSLLSKLSIDSRPRSY
ncbi:MAG: PaaX family transcriptional regulator C-terminal domain-containing protein [Patescibacteria group bacterium]